MDEFQELLRLHAQHSFFDKYYITSSFISTKLISNTYKFNTALYFGDKLRTETNISSKKGANVRFYNFLIIDDKNLITCVSSINIHLNSFTIFGNIEKI